VFSTLRHGLWLLPIAAACAQAQPAPCPPAATRLLQRFIPADCESCWHAAGEAALPARTWALDWVVPSPQGDAAPLSLAALPEAAERAQRAGAQTQQDKTARAPRLQVQGGPAWNGYFGLQLSVRGVPAPAGSTGWLALVEQIPAGDEGTAIARQLVRSVAGPLPLDGLSPRRPVQHLRALRVGEGAQPQRLVGIGWVEAADGRVLAVAQEACPKR
jgi:hypothetical protein